MLDRRALLLGAAGLAACAVPQAGPAQVAAPPVPDADFFALLDEEATWIGAGNAPRRIDLDAARLSPRAQAIYHGLAAGSAAELALHRGGLATSLFPYAVTHRNGAYRRSAASAAEIDADTARLQADAARGIAPPDFIVARTLAELAAARARRESDVATALARQEAALRALPARSAAPGVGALPGGADYYRAALSFALGDAAEPEHAFDKAARAARALQNDADALMRARGLDDGAVAERLRALADDPRYLYADSDAERDRAIADMNARLAAMRALMAPAFNDLAGTPAEVRRMTAEEEARRAPGRREGHFYYVDLADIRARPAWTLPSVVYHELLPGHILQAAASAEPHALQARYASGYSEGWATYAEMLADDLGAYADDPLARIGYLQWTLFRLARVIVDIGLHAKGWSRARAITEMHALQGEQIAFISIEEDVDRIVVQPGAYAAQGLAALDIRTLRERTRRAAGDRFDLARFHDAILRAGPLAPPGLKRAVELAFGVEL